MKRLLSRPQRAASLVALAAVVVVRPAGAQNGSIAPGCAVSATAGPAAAAAAVLQQDACQKATDLANYLAPQLGALVAGGSAELGRAGSLGGLGHFGVALRGNLLGGARVPNLSNVPLSYTGAARTDLALDNHTLALPALDVAIGLFGGVPLGVTRAGGVDLLLTGGYVPTLTTGQVRIKRTGPAVRVGYGARVGLLERSGLVPGVAVTYLHRQLPRASVLAATTEGGVLGVTSNRVSSDSWRLAAEQRFSIFNLNAGVGQDRYESRATLAASVPVLTVPGFGTLVANATQPFGQRLTRTNVYAGVSLPVTGFAQLAAEVGRASGGGMVSTYNGLSGRSPTDGYTYVSVGVRLGQ